MRKKIDEIRTMRNPRQMLYAGFHVLYTRPTTRDATPDPVADETTFTNRFPLIYFMKYELQPNDTLSADFIMTNIIRFLK